MSLAIKMEGNPTESMDIGCLVGDNNTSNLSNPDDSLWMHKIDVTGFKQLCAEGEEVG